MTPETLTSSPLESSQRPEGLSLWCSLNSWYYREGGNLEQGGNASRRSNSDKPDLKTSYQIMNDAPNTARSRMPFLGAYCLEHSRVMLKMSVQSPFLRGPRPHQLLYLSMLLPNCPTSRSSKPCFILFRNATLSHLDSTSYLHLKETCT